MASGFIPVEELVKQRDAQQGQGQSRSGFVPVQELVKQRDRQQKIDVTSRDPVVSSFVSKFKSAAYKPVDAVQRLKGQTPVHTDVVSDQYIADYMDRAEKYYSGALTDQEVGSWEYMTNPISVKERNLQAQVLKEQNANIRAWFEENKDQFDSEEYAIYMSYLDGLEEQQAGVSAFYEGVGKLGSQAEYNAELNRSNWQQQYMDAETLNAYNRLVSLQDNGGAPAELKGTEQTLQRLAGNVDLKAVKQRINELNGLISTAQLKIEDAGILEQELAQLQAWYDMVRYYKYIGKYGDLSYEELQQRISGNQQLIDNADRMPDTVWQVNNTTPEQLQDEQEWLKAYAPTRKTREDTVKENEQLINQAKEDLNWVKIYDNQFTGYASAGEEYVEVPYDYWSNKIDAIMAKYGDTFTNSGMNPQKFLSQFILELEDQNKYGDLRSNPDFEEKCQYDEEIGDKNPKYKAIGNWYETGVISDILYRKYLEMDGYEVENYLYLYNTEGKKAANDYLDSIDAELTRRLTESFSESVSSAVSENPWLGLLSAPANYFLSPIATGEYWGKSVMRGFVGDYTGEAQRPVNMSSLGLIAGTYGDNLNRATVDYIAENYDGIAETGLTIGYQLANQTIQQGLQVLTFSLVSSAGGSPALAKSITNILMSSSAFTSSVLDVRARGGTDDQAMAAGMAAGVFEWLFENYELDQLLKAGDGGFVRSFLRNAFSEGLGEGATTLSNELADRIIMGDLSNFNISVENYKAELIRKGLSPEDAERQAKKQAWIDFGKNVGTDAFMGLLGGGIFGSFKSVVSNTQLKKAFGGTRGDLLVSNILDADPDNKLALQAKERLQSGKKLSTDMLSRLVAQNPQIATDTLAYISRVYSDEFKGQSGTQWNAAQGQLLDAIPDDVLARTDQKLGKTALTFDIVELQNDPQAQQAWKDAGLTWEQLGQTYIKMPALKDEIAWRQKYSKVRSKFSAPTVKQDAASTQPAAHEEAVSDPDTTQAQQPAAPADNAPEQEVSQAQQMVQWAEEAFSRGEMTQEELDGIRKAAAAYDSVKTGSPAPEAVVPAGNVSVPDTQPNAAAQPVIPGGNGRGTASNLDTSVQQQEQERRGINTQLRMHEAELNAMEPVADITVPSEFWNWSKEQKQQWIIEKLRPTGYAVDRNGFGTIQFPPKRLRSAFNYFRIGEPAEAVFEALPSVFTDGIEIDGHTDHKGRAYSTVTIAAPITVNGNRGNLAVVVKRSSGNFYKVHRMLAPDGTMFVFKEIEAESTPGGGVTENGSLATPINSASTDRVPQEADSVKSKDVPIQDIVGREGPSGTPVPTSDGTFVPAEKPGRVRLKDPFVNAPKELWDMAQRISEITGREIVLFREKPGEHGIHDGYEQGGILHINVLSENPQATIWGHEYCHSFEKTREHESLKKGLRKLFLRKGISMEDQMRAKQAFYKKNGVDIPMDEAGRVKLENEVVAAYTSKLFTSVDDIQAMVEFNPTIIQRLSHWVDSVLAAFGNKNAAERNFLYQTKKLYQKALSGGTALKNQTEYRDTSAEFNARRQELESMLADGQITDEEYESGIAALDEEQLLQAGRTDTKKHSYAGINASTANVGKLDDAKQMLSEGVDAETIWQQTGWFQGDDGKWRFEIADSSMDISNKVLNYMTLGELVKHDALFAAYPNLADITVSFQSLPYSTMAQYDKADDHIYIDYLLKNDITYLKDVLIHEIQHVIQGWEGYTSGASVEYWKQKIREGFDAKSRTANNLYWNTAGEIEARDAADRRSLSDEERKKRHPNVGGEDVVFAENGIVAQNFVGWTADGNEVYQTSQATLGMSTSDRIAKFKSDFVNNFKGRTAKLNRNGHTVYAHFSNSTSVFGKLTYEGTATSSRSSSNGYKAKIRLLADGNVFELVEDAVYDDSKQETGKKKHKNAQHWDYFVKTIVVDGKAFDVLISVRMDVTNGNWNTKERYVYSIRFRDNKTVATSVASPATSKVQHQNDVATEDSIAENNPGVNGNFQNTDDGNEVSHSFSPVEGADTASTEATGADVKDPVVSRDTLNTKARNYLRAAENRLLTEISKALSVPRGRSMEFLRPVIQQISDEYFRTGTVSQEAMDDLFDQAYELGVVQDREFYDQYKHIKDHLRSTAVTLSQQDQTDIADFKDFRSRARNMLKIKDEGGIPVDVAYMELNDMAPELFPESITHPADQLQKMYEVADSIRITEQSLDAAHGNDPDFKKWAKHEFEAAIGESFGKLRDIVRYASDGMRKPAERITSAEQAVEAWSKLKNARRAADKAVSKNLLTESDQQKVVRLLRGEITLEHLDPETDNVKGITAVYEAKQEYEDLSRLLDDYSRRRKAENRSLAEGFLDTVLSWKDKGSGFQYSRETMWRNIQDIVPDPVLARKINEEYFFAVNRAEAKSTKFKNDFRNRVRKLQLSRKVEKGNLVSEAHAVQLYGEALDNIRVLNEKKYLKTRDGKTLSEWQAVVLNLWKENPNLDQAKIQNAVNEFRKIYDELFSMMNEVRVRNGYEPVNYRQGYFPHFQPGEESVIAQFGKVFGIEQVDVLPTTINGLTHMFKPGTQWFGNTQERLGFATAYDALEGFDRYIEGIAGVIHQTDNIQKLRAFATQIRYMASDDGIREQVDKVMTDDRLTEEEKQVQVADIYEKAPCALSKFVTELDEYTNLLANKKSRWDRTVEALLNRKFYNFMRKWEGRVAANMVGGNLGSALTNFIPLTQAWGRLKSGSMLKGMFGTLKAIWVGDGVGSMSDFLTNRRGSDPLIQNWMQKTSNTLGKPMEWIDSFVSESIIRAAYYQYKSSGMSDQNAMHCADLLAASIMADRSKGATPTLFNSYNPLVKSITQFQLEMNNQLSEVFKDLPRAYRGQRKLLVAAYTKYFIGACLFNLLFQLIAGRKPALDPIDMLWGLGEDIAEGKSAKEVVVNFSSSILEKLPFTSGLSLIGVQLEDSRMPVSSSIPDIPGMFEDAENGNWGGFFTELQKPITYNLPTGGGGQLAKTYKGVKAFVEGGSYTKDKDGKDILQYPIYNDSTGDFVGNLLKSAVFGKNSTKEGVNWVESGFDSTPAKYTAVYKSLLDCGTRDRDAYQFINDYQAITGDDQAAQRRAFVLDSDLNDEAKKVMVGVMLGTEMKEDSGNPSAYAKFLDCLDFGLTVDDYLQLRQDGGDVDRFLEFAEAGLEHSDCSKLSVAIGGLNPEKGKKQVSNQQKWRTVIQTVDDPEQQLTALSTMMDDSQYAKCSVACDNGLDPELWVMMRDVLPMYDENENGSYTQEEVKMAIDGVGGDLGARAVAGWWGLDIAKGYRHMSKKEKAVLWQLLSGAKSAQNNPYDVATGEKVLKKYNKLRDDQKDDD